MSKEDLLFNAMKLVEEWMKTGMKSYSVNIDIIDTNGVNVFVQKCDNIMYFGTEQNEIKELEAKVKALEHGKENILKEINMWTDKVLILQAENEKLKAQLEAKILKFLEENEFQLTYGYNFYLMDEPIEKVVKDWVKDN